MSDYAQAYKRILATAGNIKRNVAAFTSPPPPARSLIANADDIVDISIVFKAGPNLAHILTEDGVDPAVAEKLTQAFAGATEKLRSHTASQFKQACARLRAVPQRPNASPLRLLISQLRTTFINIFDQKLNSWVESIRKEARARITVTERTNFYSHSGPEEGRPVFNMGFVPLLDSFFAENQFPSRADKNFLAKKSGMTYRQIHVWFQNRRSRTKRSGQQSKGTSSPMCQTPNALGDAHRSEDTSEETEVDEESQGHSKLVSISRSSSCTLVSHYSECHPFDKPAPFYAFPAKYPPECEIDPFPCRTGRFTCATIEWDRRPSHDEPLHSAISVSTLEALFLKLKLNDAPLPSSVPPIRWGLYEAVEKTGCDVMQPFTVRPFKAPLFAFVSASSTRATSSATRPTIAIAPSRCTQQTPAISTANKTKKTSGPARRVPVGPPVQRKKAAPVPPAPVIDTVVHKRNASSSSAEGSTTSSRTSSCSTAYSSSSSSAPSPVTPIDSLPPQSQASGFFDFTPDTARPSEDSFDLKISSSSSKEDPTTSTWPSSGLSPSTPSDSFPVAPPNTLPLQSQALDVFDFSPHSAMPSKDSFDFNFFSSPSSYQEPSFPSLFSSFPDPLAPPSNSDFDYYGSTPF